MSMKDCPSCGTSVPESATRCKECFHDFTEAPSRRSWIGPLLVLGSVAAMAIVGAITLMVVASAPVEERMLVDGDSQSIVWTRKYQTGIETERLPFAQVGRLEYVIETNGFEVAAVTVTGDRHVLVEDVSPLGSTAESYARIMGKPLEQIDHSNGKALLH